MLLDRLVGLLSKKNASLLRNIIREHTLYPKVLYTNFAVDIHDPSI